MTNRNFWIKIRNISWVLTLLNQVPILSGHICSLYEEIFQRNDHQWRHTGSGLDMATKPSYASAQSNIAI